MSYQVLARKWRPKTFQDMVGQEHVLKALVHALENQRLHHAYLFTGTRGVGKTTIGRLLARCLNCETGVTATPCGVCDSCREVLEGRFVDLIEIDAASRTKVEDMRELLDNVQYSPTRGRFKIYLIDEVHMLSNSSFNALLKTLEEPPEHVKFLLATTDPQKLPVTILSRCLQFNLKRMTPEHVAGHLRHVLTEESIPFEDDALWSLARAADGSMRDALSLTDQAIAFGNQRLAASDVSAMLGTIDQRDIVQLVDALTQNDGPRLLAEIERIAAFSPDYSAILTDMLSLFHRVTLEQVVPGSTDNARGDAAQVQQLAKRLSAEDAQLFYQTALMGRKDLAITPDARMGFEMALLRMLAFRPGAERPAPVAAGGGSAALPQDPEPEPASTAAPVQTDTTVAPTASEPAEITVEADVNHGHVAATVVTAQASPVVPATPQPEVAKQPTPAPVDDVPPWVVEAVPDDATAEPPSTNEVAVPVEAVAEQQTPLDNIEPGETTEPSGFALEADLPQTQPVASIAEPAGYPQAPVADGTFYWPRDFRSLGLMGMPGSLASQASLSQQGQRCILTLDSGHARLLNERHREKILDALVSQFGQGVKLEVMEGDAGDETPAAWEERQRIARQQAAEAAIANDPHVQAIVARFEGRVVPDSIAPVG
ncbi:MAG: DNA polymerase III subunit gamma/tau [Marinobacter sp.]|nr:DNA polymerase III subunit gamma/tau [Marinobacter sp.]